MTPTATPVPATATITPTPTVTPTPTATPTLPAGFTTRLLRPQFLPQGYIQDGCAYLGWRWSPENSPPDTVVVPMMFHGIRQAGRPIPSGDHVTVAEEDFLNFVAYAKQLGFQTITTAQLVDFLTHNARIPRRSMILIVDDRNAGTVENHFLPVLQQNHWTVTMGWIIADTKQSLWDRVERLNETGLVDVQSHGLNHHYLTEQTPEEEIRAEIFGPIPILEEHVGKRPIGFIWPGGNFTSLAVQVAREAGYQVAFTANSNGPLLFNWIPLREAERAIGDPLMVLPRYWSSDAGFALNNALAYAEQAGAFAAQNYAQEAAWYRSVCGGELPPLEEILPGYAGNATPEP
jgi:peptidoglycan/xylan/chitin deacetylase (PgdA/CDA1 family)